MMLHTALKIELESDTAVQALMGSRFYLGVIPQKIRDGDVRVPCVVFTRSNVARQVTYCGTGGLVATNCTLDVYAATYTAARDLAGRVRRALVDFNGALGGGLDVRHIAIGNEMDLLDVDPGLHRVMLAFNVWHVEES